MLVLEELPDRTIQMLQEALDSHAGGGYRATQVCLVHYGPERGADAVRTPWGIVQILKDPTCPPGQVMLMPIGILTGSGPGASTVPVDDQTTPKDWKLDSQKNAALTWALGDEDWQFLPLGAWGPFVYKHTAGKAQVHGTDTFNMAAWKCFRAWEDAGRPGDPGGPVATVSPGAQKRPVEPEEAPPLPKYRDDPSNAPSSPGSGALPPDQGRVTERADAQERIARQQREKLW